MKIKIDAPSNVRDIWVVIIHRFVDSFDDSCLYPITFLLFVLLINI